MIDCKEKLRTGGSLEESLLLHRGHLESPELQSEQREWPQEIAKGGSSVEKALQQTGHSFLRSRFIVEFKFELVALLSS